MGAAFESLLSDLWSDPWSTCRWFASNEYNREGENLSCCKILFGNSFPRISSDGVSVAPAALLSLSALVAAKLSEARVTPAASLPMAASQPTIDLDESIAALAARAHVSAPNKKLLQKKLWQQGVGNVAELLVAIQGGTSATALGFSPAALARCERVLPDETLRSAEAAAAALAAAFAALSVAGPPGSIPRGPHGLPSR